MATVCNNFAHAEELYDLSNSRHIRQEVHDQRIMVIVALDITPVAHYSKPGECARAEPCSSSDGGSTMREIRAIVQNR